ncbi:MAG TPA: diguanylate cyclase [Bryobacteraceae bacterium]|nr:diguanylate cyclase [Bryobacteraceae bacterium]
MRGDVSIAIVAPAKPEDYFDLLWQGVWEATFDLGCFGVQVRNITTGHCDLDGQRQILSQLFYEGIDAVAVLPAHGAALNDLIGEFELRGTPVVTFQSDAPESARSAFVGPDSFQAGVLAGEVLAKLMSGRGRVASFPGPLEHHHLAQRYKGLRTELASRGCSSVEMIGELDVTADGIYVGDERLAEVAASLEERGVRVPCVGFSNTEDVRPFLANQTVSAVIDEHRYQQGYLAVQKAYEAVLKREHGGRVTGVQIPSAIVIGGNASDAGESAIGAFEMLVRQRTEVLLSYKQRLERANAELLNLSITDPLTGLLNRRKFEETLDSEVARAKRYEPMSVLMIDLNFFKAINDRYGHPAGDEALRTVAGTLTSCCRATDFCARIGGDEFAVILPHTDRPGARAVCDRIAGQMGRTRTMAGGKELSISLSVGIATLPDDAENAEALIAAADSAMYRAKEASRRVA